MENNDAQRPSRPARSQRRTRQESVVKPSTAIASPSPPHFDRQNSLDSLDDGTFGDINNVLKHVRNEWAYVMEPDFNPVTLGLNLLDDSESEALSSFLDTKHNLEDALQSIFNSHSDAFEATISAHSSFSNTLLDTAHTIHDTRYSLKEARDGLNVRRNDLRALWTKGDQLKDALATLDLIDGLRGVPERLETLISEKRWIEGVLLLDNALRVVKLPSLSDVGAIVDLRLFLLSQENALRELLIEELHNHVYLKTYHSDKRWRAYKPAEAHNQVQAQVQGEEELERYTHRLNETKLKDWRKHSEMNADANALINPIPSPTITNNSPLPSPAVPDFAESDAKGKGIPTPSESDTYEYTQSLLEALHILHRLPEVVDLLPQRLPIEMQTLISDTVEEVSSRADAVRKGCNSRRNGNKSNSNSNNDSSNNDSTTSSPAQSAVTAGIISSLFRDTDNTQKAHELDLGAHILRDLLYTLFSKINAVLSSLKAVDAVVGNLTAHSQSLSLVEMWRLVQMELQTLIQGCLIREGESGTGSTNLVASINDVLRHSASARDRAKSLFKFSDTDAKVVAKHLKSHEEALSRILSTTMPGLVGNTSSLQNNLLEQGSSTTAIGSDVDRAYTRLTPADAFNIPVLFQPTCTFIDGAETVLGVRGAAASRSQSSHHLSPLREFMDTFIEKVFLPQLQDKVMEIFQGAVASADAFAEETDRVGDSPRPVVKHKSVFGLLDLISHLSEMLRSTPFHKEAYSRLIITVIIQYYQRSSERFIDLVGRSSSASGEAATPAQGTPDLKLSAKWAQRPELTACLTELLATSDADGTKKSELCAQESRVEMGINDANRVRYDDMINSKKKLIGLGHLFSSLKWFVVKLSALKVASEQLLPDEDYTMAQRAPHNSTDKADLPLTKDMVLRFEALLQTYHQLIDMILFTMRLEVRVIVVYYFDAGLRSEYDGSDSDRPDDYILETNRQMIKIDDVASKTLTDEEKRFLFDGVGMLMDKMLMSSTRSIPYVNRNGGARMIRNIRSLQQNLKTIITWPVGIEFGASRRFWELYMTPPSQWLTEIRDKGRAEFSFDEYESLLKLQCGVLNGEGVTTTSEDDKSRRAYNDYHIELYQLMMDDEM
ncbi:hypothetical protein E3P99_00854 [Wallemia hederae]|uniref:Exocyst complex component Sec8 n=1 Tax=Wallemia hederae TaxID=1540922 RepID=A0A4T0FTD8_9BASI|nr:hypothetical protein E3P99_00854 [Wallemia hederae]